MVSGTFNRRRHERFVVPPMYTPVELKLLTHNNDVLEGHCYDVSEGGVQFELDEAVALGTAVALKFELPGEAASAEERAVHAFGNVVWLDDSEPGPVRMAVAITRFADNNDRDRLLDRIVSGQLARAA